MKYLLALQYWEGDKAEGLELAKLIADLEPRHNPTTDFLFSGRFDCKHDSKIVDHVSRKFDVHTHIGRRRETGWPAGPNALWFDTMTRMYEMQLAKKWPKYDAIFTFEPDCCPLTPGWLEMLQAEWIRAGVKCMGDVLAAPGEHMNGNAFFSGDMKFLEKIAMKIMGCSPTGGWDFLIAPILKQAGWYDTPLMKSEWARHQVFTMPELEEQIRSGLVFHHGLKNDSLKKIVREKWVPKKATPVMFK